MMLRDRLTLDGVRRTRDGYLVAEARVARSGVQLYTGREVDPDNSHGYRDRPIVRVYRPADEVFERASVATYAHRPITVDHPQTAVGPTNWHDVAVGHTGGDVVRDGDFVRVPLVLMDQRAIAAVASGKRELSMGYEATLVFGDGTAPDGTEYDAIQQDLTMNHLAIVAAARGGPELKIGDQAAMANRSVMVDGLPVEMADRDAMIVERALAALNKRVSDAEAALKGASEIHDREVAKRDAEIADLRARSIDAATLDKRVSERSALIDRARKLVPDIKVEGVSDEDVRKAVVVAKRGADAVAGKSAAYIDAAFDLLGDAPSAADPVRDALAGHRPAIGDAADADRKALEASITSLNSWRKGA